MLGGGGELKPERTRLEPIVVRDVEADGLGDGAALADSDNITGTDTESRGDVSSDSVMALLESVVLLDVMEEITTDNKSVLHLGGDNNTPIQIKQRMG